MNKETLVKAVSGKTGLSKKDVEIVVNGFIQTVTDTLAGGEKVQLQNFGNFDVRERAARKARNPQSGVEVDVPAKKVPAWKPSKTLKELIN